MANLEHDPSRITTDIKPNAHLWFLRPDGEWTVDKVPLALANNVASLDSEKLKRLVEFGANNFSIVVDPKQQTEVSLVDIPNLTPRYSFFSGRVVVDVGRHEVTVDSTELRLERHGYGMLLPILAEPFHEHSSEDLFDTIKHRASCSTDSKALNNHVRQVLFHVNKRFVNSALSERIVYKNHKGGFKLGALALAGYKVE